MAFGGPTSSRGWFPKEGISSWQRAADNWDEMQGKVESSAAEATELHILGPMRSAIRSDPSINGTDNPNWAMADRVADGLQTFSTEEGTQVGIPPDHPAAAEAVAMEYGNIDQAPSPHFRNAVDRLPAAREAFYRGLQQ